MECKENELVLRLKRGDEHAFREVYDTYYNSVRKNISKWIHNQEEIEDILQNVFMNLWISRDKIADDSNIGNWLFAVSYKRSMTAIKKAISYQKTHSIDDTSNDIFSQCIDIESHDIASVYKEDKIIRQSETLVEAIAQLPEQKKNAFVLRKIKGYSFSEVANKMELSESSVKQYVKMATITIKKSIKLKKVTFFLIYFYFTITFFQL